MSRLARWRGRPVPGVEDTGLVGWYKPPAAASPRRPGTTPAPGRSPQTATGPPGRGPAPGHLARHKTGGLEYAVEVFKCGCILLFDGQGRITGTTPCGAPDDIDRELRNLLP